MMSESYTAVPPPPPLVLAYNLDGCKPGGNAKKLVFNHLVKSGSSKLDRQELLQILLSKIRSQNDAQLYFVSHIQQVTPVLQDGPKCGLVALCMAAALLGQEEVSIDSLYEAARTRGCTKQGEMFSADEMAELCGQVLHCRASVVEGEERKRALVDAVSRGCPVLVPYDKDCNNEPCCKRGTKAHWALIAGLVLQFKHESLSQEQLHHLEQDKEVDTLYHTRGSDDLKSLSAELSSCCSHVFAYQGKSRRPSIWSLDDLMLSNAQLTSLDPKIVANIQDFVIPACGIENGLCNKIVVLQRKEIM